MFLKSIVYISKGKFIGNPNEKEISRVALLSQACFVFKFEPCFQFQPEMQTQSVFQNAQEDLEPPIVNPKPKKD